MAVAERSAGLDDRLPRAIGIPLFGAAIPLLLGLYGGLGPRDPVAWAGAASFLLLAALIWHGNRWLLFRQRHLDWLRHPARKIALLLLGIVAFTAPLTVAWLRLWYHLSGVPLDRDAVRAGALMTTICVVFVAHGYETVLLVRERAEDLLRVERLERARAEAELRALKAQVDPHFIFNCLNTLQHLIEARPADALAFNRDLAHVYRYLLRSPPRGLVPLGDELGFVERYGALLRIRYGAALRLEVGPAPADAPWAVPKAAVQTLVENAVKHNAFSARAPLSVRVRVECDAVVVENDRREAGGTAGPGLGLRNLSEQLRLLCGQGLAVERPPGAFRVRVPLLREAA